jgi:hypothetical protein
LDDARTRKVENNGTASEHLHSEIDALCRIIQKTKKMKYLLYLLAHKKIQGQVNESMNNIGFYMQSLIISNTSQPSPPADNGALQSELESEQRKCAELENMVRSHRIDVDRIQELAYIECQDDIIELVVQLSEEQAKLRQHQDQKAQLEADYMKQLISALCVVPAGQPSPFSQESSPLNLPECPINRKPLHDPVMVNGIRCRCILSRAGLRKWFEDYKKTNCPRCSSPLHDSRMFPVPELRDHGTIFHIYHGNPIW